MNKKLVKNHQFQKDYFLHKEILKKKELRNKNNYFVKN